VSGNQLRKHMAVVDDYHQRLAMLQGSWETLSLLSHLSRSGSDMTHTRQAFESLSRDLLVSLEHETLRKATQVLRSGAQIAIDIIVRNLFERTADVGFLCADQELRQFVVAMGDASLSDGERDRLLKKMRHRLGEYVAKYSVYGDIAVLDRSGNVLLQLDENSSITKSDDPLVRHTLDRSQYVETFRHIDLYSDAAQSLVYSQRIAEGREFIGVLCLRFKFDDEVTGIFKKLSIADDWTVFSFVDAQGRVVASSDPWQLPLGMQVTTALAEDGKIVRVCGREYLAVTRKTKGYQDYQGLGWFGHAMVPLEYAFYSADANANSTTRRVIAADVLGSLSSSQLIFSAQMRDIPAKAESIQRELNRTVWNGNVTLGTQDNSQNDFSKVLLWEIGNAGVRTKETFERSIGELQQTVVASILDSAERLSTLAVNILDRNMYERANDCRWWAMSGTMVEELSSQEPNRQRVGDELRYINGLYTVYHAIVVFDAKGQVIAVSNSALSSLCNQRLTEEWVPRALQLRDSQSYCVSRFEPSKLYDGRDTLIFSAAIRAGNKVVGGVAVVFDSEPQLRAILQDSLPHTDSSKIDSGSLGVLVDDAGRVMSSTDRYAIGEKLDLPALPANQLASASVQLINGHYYAIGASRTGGYREYSGLNATAYLLIPLGDAVKQRSTRQRAHSELLRRSAGDEVIDVATFYCEGQWLGISRDYIIESVDGSDLRPLPGRPSWYAGCLMHRGDPIPVIDLGRLTGRTESTSATEVIVVQVHRDAKRVGLLVDALADMTEVPIGALQPVTDSLLQSAMDIIEHVVRPRQPTDPILSIVNVGRLVAQLRAPEILTSNSTPVGVTRLAS
jgi:chemotaxis signal transduction protein